MFGRALNATARLFLIEPERRIQLVRAMLDRRPVKEIGYWLQLVLSVIIAVLGLALGSSAVVIGAMLISPLMQPLVELGMGLAIGSPILVVRAAVTTGGSMAVAVGGSAAITWLLPFHQMNDELAARTSPTALDLYIAGACALAAVYTTVRAGSDTTSAAAGTAVGIALVPPLCTAGYGLGVGDPAMARGAILLFTANLSAILAVAAVALAALGFARVGVRSLEAERTTAPEASGHISHAVVWSGRRLSRIGMAARLVLPLALLGVVFLPLRSALKEVAWHVSARSAIEGIVARAAPEAVVRRLSVERGSIDVELLLVGDEEDAAGAAERLRSEVRAATGEMAHIEIVALPDRAALEALSHRVSRAAAAPPPAPAPHDRPADLAAALRDLWPAAAGPLLDHSISVAGDVIEVRVVHLGPVLGATSEQLLAGMLAARARAPVHIVDQALPAEPIEAPHADASRWSAAALDLLSRARSAPGVHACIDLPVDPGEGEVAAGRGRRTRRDPAAEARAAAARAVREVIAGAAATWPEVSVSNGGETWRIRLSLAPCVPAEAAPATTGRAP